MDSLVNPLESIEALGFSAIGLLMLVALALVFSSYVKIITVLGILRVGLGVHSIPSALVTGGLAIALTFFVMYPTLQRGAQSMEVARTKAGPVAALDAAADEWKKFVKRHTHEEELKRFVEIAIKIDSDTGSEVRGDASSEYANSWRTLAPAFLVSELKEAFATGLSLFLPFLVIDLLVSNILVAVGLDRVSPIVVALPFKLLLFVLLDGWTLITTNLVATYAS